MHAKPRFRLSELRSNEALQRQSESSGAGAETPAKPVMPRALSFTITAIVLAVGVALVIVFWHLDRNGQVSSAIRSWGAVGILVAIGLMALFCIIPVPSEFLMIMNMKVYGVWWGILYTWVGAMVGAVVVFLIARYLGSHLLRAFISSNRFQQVNTWVEKRGAFGLLLARLVPLPFIVVNYTAGVLRSVPVWDYVWTTGVGLLPYDVGAALVFLGVSHKFLVWGIVGGAAVIAIWIAGYFFNRHVSRERRFAH